MNDIRKAGSRRCDNSIRANSLNSGRQQKEAAPCLRRIAAAAAATAAAAKRDSFNRFAPPQWRY